MALYPSYFYHSIINKYISLFGSLFTNTKIKHKISETNYNEIVIPVSFAQKKPYITRLKSDPEVAKQIAITLPRIEYEITGYMVDVERKVNRVNSFHLFDGSSSKSYFAPIPYNFTFDVGLMVQNKDDGFQVIEQWLPFFNPEVTISAQNLIPNLGAIDIPIVLNAVNEEDIYETDFMTMRSIIWTLNFTLKGYIFAPEDSSSYSSKPIKQIFVNFAGNLDVANNDPDEYITLQPGLSNTGTPTSNISETVVYTSIEATDNYDYISIITKGTET